MSSDGLYGWVLREEKESRQELYYTHVDPALKYWIELNYCSESLVLVFLKAKGRRDTEVLKQAVPHRQALQASTLRSTRPVQAIEDLQ